MVSGKKKRKIKVSKERAFRARVVPHVRFPLHRMAAKANQSGPKRLMQPAQNGASIALALTYLFFNGE